MAKFSVNGEDIDFRASPDTPLLWVIRDHLGLTGTFAFFATSHASTT